MNKKYIIIISVVCVFTLSSVFFNFVIFNKKYEIQESLSFNYNKNITWTDAGERYVNIVNLCNNKERVKKLIVKSLGNTNFDLNKIVNNIKFDPNVYARQMNIKYIVENKNDGIKILDSIANEIITENKGFIPKKYIPIEKKVSINKDVIEVDKKLNILIFAIWGLALGVGLAIIMEGKCLLKKK